MQQNTLGNIAYEITNYLGNVNVVISDRKTYVSTSAVFKAVVLSKTDYTACTRISWLNKEYGIMPTLISLNKEDIINRWHYFPFGMLNDTWFSGTESLSGVNPEWSLSGTSGEISSRTASTQEYRYGYNGMSNYTWFSGTESLSGVNPEWSFSGTSGEQDPEAKGEGNSYTTEFRQYDSRIGRWLSLDPLMAQYPMMSPYVAFNNNPIYFVDPLGLEGVDPNCESVDPECDEGSEMGTNSIPPDWYRNNRTGEEQYIEDMTQESFSWGHATFKDGKLIESYEDIWTRIDGPSQQSESFKEEKNKNEKLISSSSTVLENPWNNGGLGNILNQSSSSLSLYKEKKNTQTNNQPSEFDYINSGFIGGVSTMLGSTEYSFKWIPKHLSRKWSYNISKINGAPKSGVIYQSWKQSSQFASKWGTRLGAAGTLLSTADYVSNFDRATIGKHTNYWMSTGLFVLSVFPATAPIFAPIAFVYGAAQFGTFVGSGKSIEENLIDP